MKFGFLAIIAASIAAVASASVIPRQLCPEAARFGLPRISPPNQVPGQAYTITTDFTCSFQKGINPTYTDYTIVVPEASNNGFEPPILVARRQPNVTASSPIDTFSGTFPAAFFVAGAPYGLDLLVTYPTIGTDGSQVFVSGGIYANLNITTS